jgi:hypothetical protein
MIYHMVHVLARHGIAATWLPLLTKNSHFSCELAGKLPQGKKRINSDGANGRFHSTLERKSKRNQRKPAYRLATSPHTHRQLIHLEKE